MEKSKLDRYVGERIRDYRKANKMTQDHLANSLGLTRTSITNIEKGRQGVPLSLLYAVGRLLRCDPRDLLPSPESTFELPPIQGTATDTLMARMPKIVEQVVRQSDTGRKGWDR